MDDPKFTARLSPANIKHLSYTLVYIAKFTKQILLRFEDNGINIQATDACHVAMLNISIDRSFFDSLIACGSIGVNVEILNKILGFMEGDCFFEYQTNGKLQIKDKESEFEMTCFEIDTERFEFPEEEIREMTLIELFGDHNTFDMIETIKQWTSKFHADKVRFYLTEDKLTVSTETMETKICKTFQTNNSTIDDWCVTVNTRYITQLPKTDHLILSWKHNFPLMIEERRTDELFIQTFIAPMMDDE